MHSAAGMLASRCNTNLHARERARSDAKRSANPRPDTKPAQCLLYFSKNIVETIKLLKLSKGFFLFSSNRQFQNRTYCDLKSADRVTAHEPRETTNCQLDARIKTATFATTDFH